MLSCKLSKENISVNRAKEADRSAKRAGINHDRLLYGGNEGGPGQVAIRVGRRERKPDYIWECVGEKMGAGAQTLLEGVLL